MRLSPFDPRRAPPGCMTGVVMTPPCGRTWSHSSLPMRRRDRYSIDHLLPRCENERLTPYLMPCDTAGAHWFPAHSSEPTKSRP